jgi:hypothetical protein
MFTGRVDMDAMWRAILGRQFGASIDMLENALRACPGHLWSGRMWKENPEFSEFWYVAYHTLFWLDLYLTGSVDGFTPPAPYTLDELDPAGLLPERPYSKDELLAYLDHCRRKCHASIDALTDEQAVRRCEFTWGQVSYAELLLDNMRHVQEHAAQLSLFLGQQNGTSARWVAQPKNHSDP